MNKIRNNWLNIFIYISPILVILAQIPYFRGDIVSKIMSFSGMGLIFIYIFLKKIRLNFKYTSNIILLTLALICFVIFCFLITGDSSYFSTTISSIVITVTAFISFTLVFNDKYCSIKMGLFIEIIVFSITILSIFIYIYLMQQGFSFFGRYYYYGESKNLVGFIVSFGSILQLMLLRYKNNRIIHASEFVFCSYVELMLKSRTSIVCWIIGIMLTIFFFYRDKRIKIILTSAIFVTVIAILVNDSAYELVVNNILAAGRNLNDINDLTSGRIDGFYISYDLFKSSPLIGVGNNYIDNNILMWLSQYGMIGFIMISFLTIMMISKIRYCTKREYKIMIFIIFTMLLVNGLMESYAPFGPGTKVYCCWALLAAFVNPKLQIVSEGEKYGV